MLDPQLETLLDKVSKEIVCLPVNVIHLVGALISMSEEMPCWLREYIMSELGKRTDMKEVSPAAEAVMRLDAFGKQVDNSFAQMEIQRQLDVIRALALEDKVHVAAAFVNRLAGYLEEFAIKRNSCMVLQSTPAHGIAVQTALH